MIPIEAFVLLCILLGVFAAYYFLIGENGRIPYSDMLAALLGLFGSLYLAVHTAIGNVGYYVMHGGVSNVAIIDNTLAFVFVASAVVFLCCIIYSFVDILQDRAYRRSL